MINILDQSKILSGILGTPFFIVSSFLILVGYVVLWFRKRQTLTNAITIFEVPLIMSCLAVLFSLLHLVVKSLLLSYGIDGAIGVPFYVLTGIFYISTGMLTVANNLLLPLLFTYSIAFFVKNTNFRLIMFIMAILYTNTKYFIFLRILPNFIQYNFTSHMDISKCFVMNPIDSAMILITLILIFCRLQCSQEKLAFETIVVILEVIALGTLRIIGMVSDFIAVKMYTGHPVVPFFMSGLNTETMLMKNYEFTQMIIPYLYLICGLLVKLEEFRKRAAISISQAKETGNVRWGSEKSRAQNTVAGAGTQARQSLTIAPADLGERRPPLKKENQPEV